MILVCFPRAENALTRTGLISASWITINYEQILKRIENKIRRRTFQNLAQYRLLVTCTQMTKIVIIIDANEEAQVKKKLTKKVLCIPVTGNLNLRRPPFVKRDLITFAGYPEWGRFILI